MTGSVAIIGAGIMGACTAIELARRGVRSVLFEQADSAMAGASRWNEGKIHLGSLYAVSGGLETARRVLPGGLVFFDILERLLDTRVLTHMTQTPDVYLVHRHSLAGPDAVLAHNRAVGALVDAHPDRLRYPGEPGAADFRPVPLDDLGFETGPDIVAAVECPERSVAPGPIADLVVQRLGADPLIELRTRARVIAARETLDGFMIECAGHAEGPFGHVVNAAWEGRPSIDQASIGATDAAPHHRFRLSLFFDALDVEGLRSAVVAAGPFGDFKIYGDGRGYLSWYRAGLVAQAEAIDPPPLPALDAKRRRSIAHALLEGLCEHLPGLRRLAPAMDGATLEGGWVYAQAHGDLGDSRASIHARDRYGLFQHGCYISVDTGKYSTAPHLALSVADRIAPL